MRKITIPVLVAIAVGFAACALRPGAEAKKPNFVFILIDCWRYDHCTPEITPNAWKLGEQGIAFSDYYVNASWTRPSIAAMLSSQPPSFDLNPSRWSNGLTRFGVEVGESGYELFPKSVKTLPELLKNAGYTTIAISPSPHTGKYAGYGEKQWTKYIGIPWATGKYYGADITNEARKNLRLMQEGTPFFLYLHYVEAHNIYNKPYLPQDEIDLLDEYEKSKEINRKVELLPLARRAYADAVKFIDSQVAAVVEEVGLENAVFIVTSDHGEMFGEHGPGYFLHNDRMPEEIVHVPLLIAGAGVKAKKDTRLVQSLDLMPSILSLAGLEIPSDLAGRNLFGSKFKPTDMLIASSHQETAYISGSDIRRTDLIPPATSRQNIEDLRALGYLD